MNRTLLLCACLLLGGCGDDGDAGDGSSGTTAMTSSGDGTTAGSSANPTTGSDGSPTPGSSSGSDGSGAPLDPVEACMVTCQHLVDCGIEDVPNCAIPCVGQPEVVAGCEDPYIAQQQCVWASSCDEAQTWSAMDGDPYPCQSEDEALAACLGR